MSASPGAPPAFENATNLRQKTRSAGLDPDYWYAVEEVRRLKPGSVVEVVFWKRSIALFRGEDGSFHAIDDRCAHRQVKLSLGEVRGNRLVCAYHGWAYDADGCCVHIPHDTLERRFQNPLLKAYPVKVRYGLVWLFPGDPAMAEERKIPDIAELEGPDRWACVPLNSIWHAHHSMVIENVSDFTHAHLHREYRPFQNPVLTRCETVGDNVHISYDLEVGRGRISGLFVEHRRLNTNHMDLCFEYPYHWSNTADEIKNWLFLLPLDERTTRVFFLFYFKSLKLPFLPVRFPRFAMKTVMNISNRLLIVPLLTQDKLTIEAEQVGYDKHWTAPPIELNPVVRAFQNVIVDKWRTCLERDRVEGHA